MWKLHIANKLQYRCAVIILFLGWCTSASATTYYVDGGCGDGGNGTTITCGASGPFNTISEGLSAMAAGDVLNIRGSHATHGTCVGTNGVYREYVGIWGDTADADPGAVPPCTSGSPCVIQGCPASACGANETPVISGLVQRTDWTVASGSGSSTIYKRTMEEVDGSTNAYYGGTDLPVNNYNPHHLYTGDDIDALTPIPYGDDTSPDDNAWFFNSGTNEIYFNPAGSGDPRSDLTTWVPHIPVPLAAIGWSDCPSTSGCPDIHHITFRRLTVEGGRWINIRFNPAAWDDRVANASGLVFESIMCRYSTRACLLASTFYQPTFSNVVVHTINRGTGTQTNGSFGTRIFQMDGGTFGDLTYVHGGSDVDTQNCPWGDAPWNVQTNQLFGLVTNDFKQSNDLTISGVTCSDWCGHCVRLDCVSAATVESVNAQRVRSAVYADEYTPVAPHERTHSLVVKNCLVDDAGYGYDNVEGSFVFGPFSALEGAEFGLKIYNNFISHSSDAAISIIDVDKAYVWNNTIWQDRDPLEYTEQGASDAAGIMTSGTCGTVEIKNNIISSVNDDGIQLSANTSSVTIDYNDYNEEGTEWSGTAACMLRDTDTTCYDSLAAIQAGTAYEDHGVSGDPAFVNTVSVPPDLHIQATGVADEAGVTVTGFSTDYDNQSRPNGAAWDIGADEYLACHGG